MPIVVQKFGGTSVANADRVRAAAQRAIAAQQRGNQVVVVVSARGQLTDELIQMAEEITPNPPRREMDMLLATGEQQSIALFAMAVHHMGHKAISFTASQVGILTDSSHTRARIVEVKSHRVVEELDNGNIVIVAGFQGVDERNNITTLGRGGSDTTAVALAAALGADLCEIYTDVDGVYTADPRIVPEARKLSSISYDEMMEMSSLGAGVLQIRSVEFAKKFKVRLVVRSSLNDREGSLVCEETQGMESVLVRGCALSKDEAQISVLQIPNDPGVLPKFFVALGEKGINIDMIAQSPRAQNQADLSFTVRRGDLDEAVRLTKAVAQEVGAKEVTSNDRVAKVSVVGIGMRSQSGVAAQVFGVLAKQNIRIHMISTSEIKISCVVDEDRGEEALKGFHQAFKLSQQSAS